MFVKNKQNRFFSQKLKFLSKIKNSVKLKKNSSKVLSKIKHLAKNRFFCQKSKFSKTQNNTKNLPVLRFRLKFRIYDLDDQHPAVLIFHRLISLMHARLYLSYGLKIAFIKP